MRWLLMAVLLVSCACASTLSTLQTARPLAPGQVEVSGGLGFFVATGPLDTLADRGVDLGRATVDAVRGGRAVSLSAEDAQALLTAGAALAVGAPGPVT